MKKSFSVLLSLLLLCTMLPLSVFTVAADASGITGECIWTLTGTHLTISGNGTMGNYSSGPTVAPWGTGITEVTIEPGVTHIGNYAFYNSAALTSVTIPDTVTSIGNRAFGYCSKLATVTIPDSVYSLGSGVFFMCKGLRSISIPDAVTNIEEYSFAYCTSLSEVTLPVGISYIYANAFNLCDSLTDVYFCGSENKRTCSISSYNTDLTNATWHYYDVRSTDSGLLYTILDDEVSITGYDANLPADVVIPATIDDYPVTEIANIAFQRCYTLTSIVIPDSVTNIGSRAFYKCTALTSVSLPKGITEIRRYVFADCSALTTADIPNGVKNLHDYAFYNCTSLPSVTLPDGVVRIGRCAFQDCKAVTEITIPASVTFIGEQAFTMGTGKLASAGNLKTINVDVNNSAFSSVNGVLYNKAQTTLIQCPSGRTGTCAVPDGVTTIGTAAFSGCRKVTAIYLPDSVTTIGASAFLSCVGLTSFVIPEGITTIESSTFSGCKNLYDLTMPQSVTSIGSAAFYECGNLFDIYYGGMEEDYANITIHATSNDYIKNAVWHYADDPYHDPSFLVYEIVDGEAIITDATDTPSRLIIPSTLGGCPVTTIADEAFYWMSGMHSVTIPDTVSYIGEKAFWSCQNLYTLKIPDSVTYIGERAFYDCQGLSYVSLGNGITSIEYNTFGNCLWLWKVHIPDSVEVIKKDAFSNCRNMTSLYIPEGVTTIEENTFSQCYSLAEVSLPRSLTTLGDSAFAFCEALTDVYYNGTEEDWTNTEYNESRSHEYLLNATWHYNCINPKDHYSGRVDNSAMDTEDGTGLAYKFNFKVKGLKAIQGNKVDLTNASVNYKGKTCKVVAMGAVVSNVESNKMERDDVDGMTVIDVPVVYLNDWGSENGTFAIRIIDIPESQSDRTIYARPYYIIETPDGIITVYGDISSASCAEYM